MNIELSPELERKLLDKNTCLECFNHSRLSIAPQSIKPKLLELLKRCRFRTELFVESYALIYGDSDPYRDLKSRLNELALGILSEVLEPSIESMLMLSAAGNAVDVSMPWYKGFDLASELRRAKLEIHSNVDAASRALEDAKTVAVLLDNAGEVVIDIALAQLLASRGKSTYLIARSLPYETDATCSEVLELVDRVSDVLGFGAREAVRIVCTGSRYPAPATGFVDARVTNLLRDADVVISKGIANLEALLEFGFDEPQKVVTILKAKCLPIANLFRTNLGSVIVATLSNVHENALS
ncbi:MAG: DUF89 family protein [Crenarchaeota archaeon]|nr:DUF89 family protein [Thermoproteota archaeon]